MSWNVYIIRFPNRKKYVGVSRFSVETRVRQHIRSALRGGDLTLHCAIRKYGADSLRWGGVARCGTEQEAKALEREYIQELGTLRPAGYNSTVGGNGVIDPSGLSEKKRVARMRHTMATPLYRQRQREIQSSVWTASLRAVRAEQIRQLWACPEYRARQSRAHTRLDAVCHHRRLLSSEEKSVICRGVWNRPGHRERQSLSHIRTQSTPGYRLQVQQQMRRLMADPEYRRKHAERMREAMNRPEVRLRCSLAHLRRAS